MYAKTPSYLLTVLVSFELEYFLCIPSHCVLNWSICCLYHINCVLNLNICCSYYISVFWIRICFCLYQVIVFWSEVFAVYTILLLFFKWNICCLYHITVFSIGTFVNYITVFWTESFAVYTISLCSELEHLPFILYHCALNNRICCLWLCLEEFKLVAKEYPFLCRYW